jgi:hypothetical protein
LSLPCTRSICALVVVVACMPGCAPIVSTSVPSEPPRGAVVVDPEETRHCLRVAVGSRRGDRDWPAVAVEDPVLAAHLDEVPPTVRRSARAAGLEPLLAQLLRARDEPADDDRDTALVSMRLQAMMRLSSLEIELSASLFEADCVGDQMEAVLRELDRRGRRQEIGLAVASVLVGAAAGIGAGIWDLQGGTTGPVAFGITGGAVSAGLGVVAFVPPRGRVVFAHERNLLAPIAAGEDPRHLYPSFAFEMLTTAREPGGLTPRDEIVAAWRKLVAALVREDRRAQAEAVLFGRGGTYDGDLVHLREQMFDVLESHLNAIERDLEELYAYFGSVIAQAP